MAGMEIYYESPPPIRRYEIRYAKCARQTFMGGGATCPPGAWRFTIKVRSRLGGMNSGMPSAPAKLSWVVVQPARRAHGGLQRKLLLLIPAPNPENNGGPAHTYSCKQHHQRSAPQFKSHASQISEYKPGAYGIQRSI